MQKYLQPQNVILAIIVCNLIGIGVNILFNYILMTAVGLGFMGCGIATSTSRLVMLVALIMYFAFRDDFKRFSSY